MAESGGPYVHDSGTNLLLDGSLSLDPDAWDVIVSYEWDLGDDGTIDYTGVTAVVPWADMSSLPQPGVAIPVRLRVTDTLGVTDDSTTVLTVYDNQPVAFFTAGPNPAGCGQEIIFDANRSSHGHPDRAIVLYEWDFEGDGTYDLSSESPTATYAHPQFGSYTAELRVTDDNRPPQMDTTTLVIDVSLGNQSPVADANGPYWITVGEDLTVDGTGSSDADTGCGDGIVSYEWDLNDDGTFEYSGATVDVPWADMSALPQPDLATLIRLRVTDSFGETGEATTTLTTFDNQPIASFTVDPNPAMRNQQIQFDASSSTHGRPDRSIVEYQWDFDGDGTFDVSSAEATATYSYPEFGQYSVTLRVTDDNEPARSDTAALVVEVQPVARPMKQADIWNTGRANFTVPPERLDDSLFDIFLWQQPSPNSPADGNLSSTSMVFYDGVGPADEDLVLGSYHWPKGVQAMDRHTGEILWYGNPDGGESIGTNTPAFSNDGSVIYVTNDATPHPLMAFEAAVGPSDYWHNGNDPGVANLMGSPAVAPDGRVFLHRWDDRAYGATDHGDSLTTTWSAATQTRPTHSEPALYQDADGLQVVTAGQFIAAYDGDTGAELWNVATPSATEATTTIDPANGNIYVPLGSNDIYLAGLDQDSQPLWDTATVLVYDWFDGQNNPQRAFSAGALSYDGATYYFQTVSQQGDGQLYAMDTSDGSVKWSFATGSQGWNDMVSSPIVTRNGVIVVGNNEGDTYFSIQDVGTEGHLLDSYAVDPDGTARASATVSPDGLLYLPLRTVRVAGAGGEMPSFQVENLLTAMDLNAGATATLYPPGGQTAVALNHAVKVSWRTLPDPTGQFDHYAIYRATQPFDSVDGMLPIGTVDQVEVTEYVDNTAENGTSYYYAVTTVSQSGGEVRDVASIGPRTPWDETDLQLVSIARDPEYPRYDALYTHYEVTEPSGYGPYGFSASTGLGGGQTFDDPRFPEPGDPVTYAATVRNRGTNPYTGSLAGTWTLDGIVVGTDAQTVDLDPGQTATFTHVLSWDDSPHTLTFAIDVTDARAGNNQLTSDPLAVPFLTYVDRSFIEEFREVYTADPLTQNDDIIDWLNSHMARFNELFADAGTEKRVHYGVLQVLDDGEPDPPIDYSNNPYAIFPFRYRATDGDPRLSGYYHADGDIDYGLLHEMGHQLGLIDIYQLDVPADSNLVSGMGYSGPDGLMRGVSPFLSDFSALAMQHWLRQAHGYYGQFMYNLPENLQLRILGFDGNPLAGAAVKAYQYCDRPGQGKVITDQIKFQGTTDANGLFTLPNVAIDPSLVPPVATGDQLHDNPFGYLAVVGTNGVLHFRVEYNGGIDYAWLDVTEANVAYWQGQTATATFDRQLALGGPVQVVPPEDLAELNANDWSAWAEGATASVDDDTVRTVVGDGAIGFVTDGGFDTYARYPRTFTDQWDLTPYKYLNVNFYAENDNLGFQNSSPWIRLRDAEGDYFQYQYYQNGNPHELLNDARNTWQSYKIPLDAAADTQDGWRRTVLGTPDLANIQFVEIHADTWGAGFTLWMDGVGFSDGIDTSFASASSSAGESAGTHSVPVTLHVDGGGTLAEDVTFYVDTVDGAAEGSLDFTPLSDEPVVFPAGSASGATALVQVEILPDQIIEGDETFELRLYRDPAGSSLGQHQVTITDHDPNLPPVADASGLYLIAIGQDLQLDGSASQDPNDGLGDEIASYEWDLDNDGLFGDAVGATPTMAFADLETLGWAFPADPATGLPNNAVRLLVTDSFGLTSEASTVVTIYDNRPIASFTATPNPANADQVVTFDAASSHHGHPNHGIVQYEWDFDGDGTYDASGAGPTATHAYPATGTYSATLRVTDDNGPALTDTTTLEVAVESANHPPVVDAGGDGASLQGQAFARSGSFADPDAGDTCTAKVDYGDGSGPQPLALDGNTFQLSHVYADEGRYPVTVTVQDSAGASGEVALTVNVVGIDRLEEVTAVVSVEYGRSVFNRRTGEQQTDVIVTNTSSAVVEGPLAFVVTSISDPGITLANPTGQTPEGHPFVDLTGQTGADGLLSPGEATTPFTLRFNNPARARFTFQSDILGASVDLQVTDFDVQNGATQRSLIQKLDVTFDLPVLGGLIGSVNDADASNDRIWLQRFELDGSGVGERIGIAGKLSAIDRVMTLNFGNDGLGGSPGSNAADGYYKLSIDLDGNLDNGFDDELTFYRLLGNVNADRVVDQIDVDAIAAAIGTADLEKDINSDGEVTATDRALAEGARGRQLAVGLELDD